MTYGELAALGTSVCWTASAMLFEVASKRSGSLAVNFFKVLAAFFFLGATAWITRGVPFPYDAAGHNWLFLSLSGIIGFVITDYFLFEAYIEIGARQTMVFMALSPAFTVAIGAAFLGEALTWNKLAGAMAVVGAITLAVLGKRREPTVAAATSVATSGGEGLASGSGPGIDRHNKARGYLFAALAALGQAVGVAFTKRGVEGYDFWSGTQIRVLAAIAGFILFGLVTRTIGRIPKAARDGVTMRFTMIGAVFGPFLGVALSLLALKTVDSGTVSVLISLMPVMAIPPSVLILKQRVGALEALAAALAVLGVWVLVS
jgi:drug/metabolite transporter (DMT)-like permease